MLKQGQLSHVKLPLTSNALKPFDEAASQGLDAKDCTALLVWWLGQGGKA
jgi:hypothetical protein